MRSLAIAPPTESPTDGIEVRVLGPVEVRGPRGPGALAGARQRTLMGLLALEAGSVLSRSRIIDSLWGDCPPRTAVKSLYSHVVRVRQALDDCGLHDALSTRGSGYVLQLPRASVDVWVFENQVRRARQAQRDGDWERVARELRAGLHLWRGEPLADGEPAGWGAAEAARVSAVRLTAQEDLWQAELNLGNHHRIAAKVERLLVLHPLRERSVELLMRALDRAGRDAEALEAYHRLRSRLAAELGVEPGRELQRTYAAILRRDPPAPLPRGALAVRSPARSPTRARSSTRAWTPTPAQLPGRVGHFTGRLSELDSLDRLLDAGPDEPRIAAITGPAGTGKTALAVQWSHRVVRHFPDGQLFLDLGETDAHAGLRRLLVGLGAAAARIPTDLADQGNLYRSLLAGRTMLILLDNATSTHQLLPLVPGDEASLLLVTSRDRLGDLAARHAVRHLGLGPLSEPEALALLGRVVGTERIDQEPGAAADIVHSCRGLPRALRAAAATIATEPDRKLADMVVQLSEQDRPASLAMPLRRASLRR